LLTLDDGEQSSGNGNYGIKSSTIIYGRTAAVITGEIVRQ
jgi:hypothetical protein